MKQLEDDLLERFNKLVESRIGLCIRNDNTALLFRGRKINIKGRS